MQLGTQTYLARTEYPASSQHFYAPEYSYDHTSYESPGEFLSQSSSIHFAFGNEDVHWSRNTHYGQEIQSTQAFRLSGTDFLADDYSPSASRASTLPTSIASSSMYTGTQNTSPSASDVGPLSPLTRAATASSYPESYHTEASSAYAFVSDAQDFDVSTPEQEFGNASATTDPPFHTSIPAYEPSEREQSYASEMVATEEDDNPLDSDYDCNDRRSRRPRRLTLVSSIPRRQEGRILKRASNAHSSTSGTRDQSSSNRDSLHSARDRLFHCPLDPYGCKSTFGSKNEWKRHFSTQHMRLGFWQCDQCPATSSRKSREFNRKDLFMQHVRRMHTKLKQPPRSSKSKSKQAKISQDDSEAIEAAKRCYRLVRSSPTRSMCIVCGETFQGPASWDQRMEHIGRHFEEVKRGHVNDFTAVSSDSWAIDEHAEAWMIEHGVLLVTEDGELAVPEENKHD